MEKNIRFFGYGIFALLVVVLGVFFVMAASWSLAPSTAEAGGDTISMLAFNVSSNTQDNSSNVTNFTTVLINITGTAFSGIENITNITISNGTRIFYNDSFTTSPVNLTLNVNVSTSSNNWTVNFTLNSSATWNVTAGADVTAIGNYSYEGLANLTYSTLPYSSGLTNTTETTNPTATAACSDVFAAKDFPCTCTGTDSGAAASGVSTSVGSSNSSDGITTPLTVGDFTYTCTVTDVAGNSATNTATYSILDSSGSRVGSTSSTPSLPKKTHSFAKIIPGAVAIVKNFDSEIGIKEIKIEVNNEARNVKIIVTKYDGKPAEVSVTKSGKVNQYLEIEVSNVEGKLDRATITARVKKLWVSNNGLKIDGVALFKFDDFREEWNELTTNYVGSEDDYYYYDAEVSSFSFFAISEKSVVEEDTGTGTTTGTGAGTGDEEEGSLVWLWILIGLLILVAIGWKAKSGK